MYLLNSEQRIDKLVPLIEHEPAEIFWPIFTDVWPMCDRTYDWHGRLADALRRVGPHPSIIADDLPVLTVYRGGSRARIAGAISWTTDLAVAQNFAAGHRFIPVHDPVIAKAMVDKAEVY
jgi:hypothetical protein